MGAAADETAVDETEAGEAGTPHTQTQRHGVLAMVNTPL